MLTSQRFLLLLLATLSLGVGAQEAAIRKNLAERLPNFPPIDEVSKTPMTGVYELRVNHSDIFYTDEQGNYLIQGSMFDTQAHVDLTEKRLEKLNAIAFKELPIKDAFTIVRGNGKRKMAIFSDPNCGYCKRLERELVKLDNITIHLFLYPILGADSAEKSRSIFCAKDKAKAYLDWMVRDLATPAGSCNAAAAALARNVEFGKKNRITGTPTIFFADGTRVPGAIEIARIEKMLNEAKP
jgi:thiol:disulfide interchange protein DsbC